jgi:indole-3-glycerol phosphate synthase
MRDILKEILIQKHKEVALIKNSYPNLCNQIRSREFRYEKSLRHALKNEELSVIAEIKKKSPSKGTIADIDNPVSLAQEYVSGGADAISVLTEKSFFGGSLQDMTNVSMFLKDTCPVLRKDFIVDEFQIYEAVAAGADAILLIVAVLGNRTKDFLKIAKNINIEALVEVHSKTELEIAIGSGAEIVGINNRDLNTFHVNMNTSLELVELIPKNVIRVSESGISSPNIAKKLRQAGFDAVLVGEALIRTENPSLLIREYKK